jgi:foldase protein PrsA
MRRLLQIGTAAAVLTLAAATPVRAQEEPLPDGVVAQVGGEPIAETDFRHWLRTSVRVTGAGPLDPPRFERCIAAGRRRPQCQRRYEVLLREVMDFLLQAVWVRQEATAMGIAVSAERVRRSLERQKRSAFLTERAYRRFLRSSGMSEADLLFRVELDMLLGRLTGAVADSAQPVTDEEIDRYYASHRRRFRGESRRAARRAIRGILTARRQQNAIERFGRSFRSRYRAITTCAQDYLIPSCGNFRG